MIAITQTSEYVYHLININRRKEIFHVNLQEETVVDMHLGIGQDRLLGTEAMGAIVHLNVFQYVLIDPILYIFQGIMWSRQLSYTTAFLSDIECAVVTICTINYAIYILLIQAQQKTKMLAVEDNGEVTLKQILGIVQASLCKLIRYASGTIICLPVSNQFINFLFCHKSSCILKREGRNTNMK